MDLYETAGSIAAAPGRGQGAEGHLVEPSRLELALVRVRSRMPRGLKLFREITGLTAVVSLATSLRDAERPASLLPPLHPRCADRLRSLRKAPCREQWQIHVRAGRRSPRTHSHTCPIGLRCSCVPIHLGGHLVGVAKLVVDSGTPDPAFRAATNALKLVVSATHQDSYVSVLSDEVRALRQRVDGFRQVRSNGIPRADSPGPRTAAGSPEEAGVHNGALVYRALDYLQAHFQEPGLSLTAVAESLGCNRRYLTCRFTQIVGERMRSFIVVFRVSHACRLLLSTDLLVKEVAYASGFRGQGRLARAFQRHVGVSPGEYRRIFAAP